MGYEQAVAHVVATKLASVNNLQCRLRVGLMDAQRFMDQMEEEGIVSSYNYETKSRKVLVKA